ncbi:hypothetical protein NX059_008033 [Plenodomus lindquistii]|nr:hypothetical protein NX059_008033 [Plenodomus lindquistii]
MEHASSLGHGFEQGIDPPPPSYRSSTQNQTPLDLTQRFERKLANYNASQNVIKRWLFEIVSWITSAMCMGFIIGICLYTRDQPLSRWPWALTVNNILSKIASAALILPISEAIGQLKWTWFTGGESREMIDFEIFDKASRGAWGSFLLLFRTRGKSLAALGAVLTLLLLATDTFFQQVTDLPERWVLKGYGEIPRVVRYEGDNGQLYQDGLPANVDDINLRQAVLKFFYYGGNTPVAFGNGTRPEIPLSCPSSRCEWEPYDSLGMCSACADVSELLTYACLESKLDWISSAYYNASRQSTGTSCGYWLNATSAAPILMSGYRIDTSSNVSTEGEALLFRALPLNPPITSIQPFSSTPWFGGSIKFKDVYFPTVDALIVSAADGTADSVYKKAPPVAQECVLSWCVKTFQSSYLGGDYKETVTETYMNTTARQQPYPWEVFPIHSQGEDAFFTIFHGNISIHPPWTNLSTADFGVSNETYSRTQALFEDIFPSFITVANATAPAWWRVLVLDWGYNQLRPVTTSPWLAPNNVTQYMDRLATSLTNVIRSHSSHEFVRGQAYSQTIFIGAHLEWLTFPLCLLAFSFIFLLATMLKTSKDNDNEMSVWKTSAMPALIYSLPKETQNSLTPPSVRRCGMSRRSQKIKIRLHPKQGWRVSGQALISPRSVAQETPHPPPGWI